MDLEPLWDMLPAMYTLYEASKSLGLDHLHHLHELDGLRLRSLGAGTISGPPVPHLVEPLCVSSNQVPFAGNSPNRVLRRVERGSEQG